MKQARETYLNINVSQSVSQSVTSSVNRKCIINRMGGKQNVHFSFLWYQDIGNVKYDIYIFTILLSLVQQ